LLKKWYEARRIGHIKDKINISLLFSGNILLITLDLFTTKLALTRPYTYEALPFGNNPYLEYPIIMGVTLIIYLWEKHYNIRHLISPCYCLLTLAPIINNLVVYLQ